MIPNKKNPRGAKGVALLSTSCLAMCLSGVAFAQDEPIKTVPTPSAESYADKPADEMVVTGSRLRKNEFNSASPLSVLEVDKQRDLGITSVQEMLSRAVVANGAQIDQSRDDSPGGVGGALGSVPPGGVGSSNISLRGLGPERTLILVNGRRLAATGVRGAPAQPSGKNASGAFIAGSPRIRAIQSAMTGVGSTPARSSHWT